MRVSFKGVEGGGGKRSAHLPEDGGPYTFLIADATEGEGQDSGKAYINVKARVSKGEYRGKTVYHICSLQKKALFNLRNIMTACGMDPGERTFDSVKICKALKGKTFQADVEDDTYNGKTKSVLSEFVFDAPTTKRKRAADDDDEEDEEEEEEDEEEEEKPARRSRTKVTTKSASKRKARDEDEDDDEDLDDIDLDDL